MTVWEELKARGLIAQVTDEDEIKEMVNNGKATFYIGFDPTADSLHVGHFMADTQSQNKNACYTHDGSGDGAQCGFDGCGETFPDKWSDDAFDTMPLCMSDCLYRARGKSQDAKA